MKESRNSIGIRVRGWFFHPSQLPRLVVLGLAVSLMAACTPREEERCRRLYTKLASCYGLSVDEDRVLRPMKLCEKEQPFSGADGAKLYSAFMEQDCSQMRDRMGRTVLDVFPD